MGELVVKKLRVWALCIALQAGVLSGVPMRPDEIRDLLNRFNQPAVAHVLPSEDDHGDDDDSPAVA
jgi:hypothetical protein